VSREEHTPGPWTVGSGKFYMDYSAIGAVVEGGDGEPFVSIAKSGHAAADASVIAAAPDLLAALEVIVRAWPDVLAVFTPTVLDQARAAIAKATGSTGETP
jgi:hypothetical protein